MNWITGSPSCMYCQSKTSWEGCWLSQCVILGLFHTACGMHSKEPMLTARLVQAMAVSFGTSIHGLWVGRARSKKDRARATRRKNLT